VSMRVERDALSLSRARLIRQLVEEMPVPVVVLDRALRVTACSLEWIRAYGLESREAANGRPLGKLVEVSCETTAAIIEALHGRTGHAGLSFYTEDNQRVRRSCAVIPWQCGTDAAGGVIMVIGGGEQSFASIEVADCALGRHTKGLLELLETA
jgi:PAS domain-containing protein